MPAAAEVERASQRRNRGLEVAHPYLKTADAGVRGDERIGMIDGLGDADALDAATNALGEFAQLGQAPDQRRPRVNRRQLRETEGLALQLAAERRDVPVQERRGAAVAAQHVVGLRQVGVRSEPRAELAVRLGERQRLAAVLDRPIRVAHQPEVIRHECRHLAQAALVVQGSPQLFRLPEEFQDARELAERLEGVAQVESQVDGVLGPLPALGQTREGVEGLLAVRDRLPVRAPAVRLHAGLPEVSVGLRPHGALERVVGEPFHMLGETLGIRALERLYDLRVELAPRLGEEAPVRDFVGERVLERVFGVRARARLVEELGALEPVERPAEPVVRRLRDQAHDRERNVLTDDRGDFEEPPVFRGEAIDATQQHLLDRVGHRERG